MIAFPNAKINLGLNIIGKRDDGYHDIESCFYPIPWHDALEVMEANSFTFHAYGIPIPGDVSTNLCIKAYEVLQEDYDFPPVEIHLVKNIPMGAGLGGGSADGAFTLKLINDLFELKITNDQLEAYALQLGSDCPFFIQNKPALAKGRGEELEEIPVALSGYYLAIQNPGIHISTKEAYEGIILRHHKTGIAEILNNPIQDWKKDLKNDFESSLFPKHPTIVELKEYLYEQGASYASMTGSGSTVYGLFKEKPEMKDWKVIHL